jgi:5-methylcytosine-specific restriction endonuclease McrA
MTPQAPTCPRCHSTDCASNAFKNATPGTIVNNAIAVRQPNWLRNALSELVVWAGINAANWIRPTHKCGYCGFTF